MFIQSRIARDYPLGTTDGEETWLLPTQPLSAIVFGLFASTDGANEPADPFGLVGQLLSIDVLFRGTQIWSVGGDDLVRLTNALGIHTPSFREPGTGDNQAVYVTFALPFGRQLFLASEAFPASRGGELELRVQWDAATDKYDNLQLNIHTIELPDANPANFLRVTTMSDTPGATGVKDYDLPRQAPLLGIGIWQTSSFPFVTANTIDTVKVLRNNQDFGYTDADLKTIRGLQPFNRQRSLSFDIWKQLENTGASYTQNAETSHNFMEETIDRDFTYLDYDPLRDGVHVLNGTNASDLKLRVDFNAAEAIRIFPVEWFSPNMLPGRRGGN